LGCADTLCRIRGHFCEGTWQSGLVWGARTPFAEFVVISVRALCRIRGHFCEGTWQSGWGAWTPFAEFVVISVRVLGRAGAWTHFAEFVVISVRALGRAALFGARGHTLQNSWSFLWGHLAERPCLGRVDTLCRIRGHFCGGTWVMCVCLCVGLSVRRALAQHDVVVI
jgi:hypothetical protein